MTIFKKKKVFRKTNSCVYKYHSIHTRLLYMTKPVWSHVLACKVKSCYNPLRLGTVLVLVSSGIDFVNTPRLYSDRATR